jgi:hypothetical protein
MLRGEMTAVQHTSRRIVTAVTPRHHVRPVVRQIHPVTAHPMTDGAQARLSARWALGDLRRRASATGDR